jgi:hypothetical protein
MIKSCLILRNTMKVMWECEIGMWCDPGWLDQDQEWELNI